MTRADGPADDRDPIADGPASVGVCLDLDGTVYRSGVAILETLAFLPYAADDWDREAERHRRRALMAIAEYGGGPSVRRRWGWTLSALSAVRRVGLTGTAERLLDAVADLEAAGDSRTDPPGDYAEMQATVLSAYGDLVAGRSTQWAESAAERVASRRFDPDESLVAALGDLRRWCDAEVVLVTDAPEHLAWPYARRVGDDVEVVGTRYPVADGAFTGECEPIEKGAAVARLRETRGWDYVVAAGDTPADLAMRTAADVFLAVEGRTPFGDALEKPIELGDAAVLGKLLSPDRRTIRVGRDESLATALRRTARAVGLR